MLHAADKSERKRLEIFPLYVEYMHIPFTGLDMSQIYGDYVNNGILLLVATGYYFMCTFPGYTSILCLHEITTA